VLVSLDAPGHGSFSESVLEALREVPHVAHSSSAGLIPALA
jgi:hypothetical protein